MNTRRRHGRKSAPLHHEIYPSSSRRLANLRPGKRRRRVENRRQRPSRWRMCTLQGGPGGNVGRTEGKNTRRDRGNREVTRCKVSAGSRSVPEGPVRRPLYTSSHVVWRRLCLVQSSRELCAIGRLAQRFTNGRKRFVPSQAHCRQVS